MTLPPWALGAAELAGKIRKGDLSSEDVVRAHLDRIEEVNPSVNALTVIMREGATRSAKAADRAIETEEVVGPLHGVPFTVKETIDVAGTATTHGIVDMRGSLPETDAPVVALLKSAGAIPIGRTNTPGFGVRYHTDNDLWGATVNPWDSVRTPGGSSGGEAAAISTGMSPLGVGGDMGGSLRYPAQCCGVATIRPSFGRTSRIQTTLFGDTPMLYEQIACVPGPMARRVEDLRLALDVMSQRDGEDPWQVPAYSPDANVKYPIPVALVTRPAGHAVSPHVEAAVRTAGRALESAGYRVEEIDPPLLDETTAIIQHIADTEMSYFLPAMLPRMSEEARIFIELLMGDRKPDLNSYMTAIADRYRVASRWKKFMQQYPLILGPVSTLEPFEVGWDITGPEAVKLFVESITLTESCNLLGLPSVAIPVQISSGLPQGVQLISMRYHDSLCLDAAECIERDLGIFTPIDPVNSST